MELALARMLSGLLCNKCVGILCLQSAFTSTNKRTWGRTLTEGKCSSSQSTLVPSGRRRLCSRLSRLASTAPSSKRPSSRSSSRATEARRCQVKHSARALWEMLETLTCPPIPTVLAVPLTSAEHHSPLRKMSCCRNCLGVRWKYLG